MVIATVAAVVVAAAMENVENGVEVAKAVLMAMAGSVAVVTLVAKREVWWKLRLGLHGDGGGRNDGEVVMVEEGRRPTRARW